MPFYNLKTLESFVNKHILMFASHGPYIWLHINVGRVISNAVVLLVIPHSFLCATKHLLGVKCLKGKPLSCVTVAD